MTRPARLHVPAGLYYIVLRGNGGEAIFRDVEDYREFGALVAKSLRRNRCRLHAFCWLENRVLMATQIADVRVGRFVQYVTGQHAKHLHSKLKRTGHLFEHHHRALLVQRSHYLLHLVRYIHRAPVREGLVAEPSDYAWSGDRTYQGKERVPWLTTHIAKEMLTHSGRSGLISYRDWVSQDDDPAVAGLLEHGSKDESRVLGDDAFIAAVSDRVELPRPDGMLDEIITSVAQAQGVLLRSVLSPSRRRQHVLARALITWKATQSGVATLTEVAARLGRDPSTLWTAIERYRTLHPELFPEQGAEVAGGADLADPPAGLVGNHYPED